MYTHNKNESEKYTKNNELFISPDKYSNYIDKRKNYNNKDFIILSSSKNISKDNNNNYYTKNLDKNYNLSQDEQISNKNEINSSIFNVTKPDYFNNNKMIKSGKNDNDNLLIRINKNISNYSKISKYDENDVEIEQFNNSDRHIEKTNKKIGTDIRTKIIKKNQIKNQFKNAYSPIINTNYNLNNDKINNNIISNDGRIIKMNSFLSKKSDKISSTPINNTNNYINNNIIIKKNTNLYLMSGSNESGNDNMDNSMDSFQKKEMTYKFNHQNTVYKKRNPNECKIINSNNNINMDRNNFNIQKINKQFANSPVIQNISINNIYDFDVPQQNSTKTFLRKTFKNNISNNEDINNYNIKNTNRVNTPLTRENISSERNFKEKDNKNNMKKNEHTNNFKNNIFRKENNKLLNKSNDIYEMRKNQMRSPQIYKKKLDSKNRPFILQKENKINNISNNSFNNKNDIYLNEGISVDEYNKDNISTNQREFKREIKEIYNKQNKNNIECNRVNNFELTGNKKNNLIKPPIIIDENKNEKIINIDLNKSNINKKRIKLNKDKKNYNYNDNNRLNKSNNNKKNKNILIKPINKYFFKKKFYCYHIKTYQIKKCYYSKEYISKNPIIKRNNKISSNSIFMNKSEIINNFGEINEENQDNIFTEKIPVHIDNNLNNLNSINNNNEYLYLIENSFKDNKSQKNESTSNFRNINEIKSYINNENISFSKIKENAAKLNKFNNQKNNDNEDLEMTFGIEEIHSKINTYNQFDANSNINDFSTINNNTNHSIVINEYIINNNNEKNRIATEKKNNIKSRGYDNNKLNDYLEDEEENQNDDIRVLSDEEDEEIKKEDEKKNNYIINNNINSNINNSIVKRNDEKILQVTEGKEIVGDVIPDKINKGLKLLEKIQIKRKSKKDFITNEKNTLSNSDNNNFIFMDNFNDNNELLLNKNKNNVLFEKEILNPDIYQKKNNTFKPKKSKRIIENMTKNKKCEILNDILTELFDKKEKEKEKGKITDIRCKTPLYNRTANNDDDKENEHQHEHEYEYGDNKDIDNINNVYMMENINKKNTYNPKYNMKKIEKYEKIFNLNPIKNLEDILNKKKNSNMFDFNYNYNKDINDDFKNNKQSVLTYNKKLKNKISSFEEENNDNDIISDNNFLSNSNKLIGLYYYQNFKDKNYNVNKVNKVNNNNYNYNIEDYRKNNKKLVYHDTPKFINRPEDVIKEYNNKKIFSLNEIISFNEKNNLCFKENLLPKRVINHCNELLNYTEIDYIKSNIVNTNNNINNIKKWNRKDMSKEIREAEKYIKDMTREMSKDNFKCQIIEILNTITVDNYEEILNRLSIFIYNIDSKGNNKYNKTIKPEILLDNQYRFAEIIIDKAIMENGYVKLYAKLCHDLYRLLDKVIDKYLDINVRKQIYNSENLKSLLIGESKQRFNDYQYNGVQEEIDYDIIYLIKKKFLGNINFIVELINVRLLSQKIGFDFLDILLRNYKDKEIDDKNKYLNLEGIITLLNKFGKIVSERKNERHIQNLNNYMYDYIIPIINGKKEKDKNIPGYLKYKIINLIEKQKNNWEESLYEKSIIAKGRNNNFEYITKNDNDNNNVIDDYNTNRKNEDKERNDININISIISNNEDNEDKDSNNTRNKIYFENNSETLRIRIKKRKEKRRNKSMEILMRYDNDFLLNESMKNE